MMEREDGLQTIEETIEYPPCGPCPVCGKRRHRRPPKRVVISAIAVLLAGLLAAATIHLMPRSAVAAVPASQARYYSWAQGTPRGITLSALQDYVMTPQVITTMENQIRASKTYWHANTVRFQITQDRLVGSDGRHFHSWYMRDIRLVTGFALRRGLNVVLNAQTEQSVGYSHNEPLPTRATYEFFRRLTRWYGKYRHVTFDLFNEPRHCSWGKWFDAHQGLLTALRREGSRNWIWVEGRWWGSTLEGAPLLRDPLHRLAYTYHHPGAPKPWQAPVTQATWDASFGNLAAHGVPVVDGEFTNFVGSYYWGYPDLPGQRSAPLVRQYLAYLTAHHIGLLAWSLVPGALNQNLDFASETTEPQGAGHLIRTWFRRTARADHHH
jgi:hypothetical protein